MGSRREDVRQERGDVVVTLWVSGNEDKEMVCLLFLNMGFLAEPKSSGLVLPRYVDLKLEQGSKIGQGGRVRRTTAEVIT